VVSKKPFPAVFALASALLFALVFGGCQGCEDPDGSGTGESGTEQISTDAGEPGGDADSGPLDSGSIHADSGSSGDDGGSPGLFDSGSGLGDGGATDGGLFHVGSDAGAPLLDSGAIADSGQSGSPDAGAPDAGPPDAGPPDAGPPDAGPPDAGPPPDSGPAMGSCQSGATGQYVARFRWEGNGSGSTAYVVYETNTLPDASRWHAGAYEGFNYTPTYRDVFLAEGGLELDGAAFIDVELSTQGLPPVSTATIAIFGRSFNTTASGSFSWQSFSDVGSSPYGGVANSAPYEWYSADATTALPAGDDGTLLRIRPEGPSNALIVRKVEICFNTN
jgi:hypothetical protein